MTYNYTLPVTCNAGLLGPSLVEMCGASAYYVFMSLLDTFARSNQKISGTCERVKPIEIPDPEYDYVVIGGGAGGSVVAARLTENPSWNVLLLEAGPDEPVGAAIPSFLFTVMDSSIDWGYRSTNESYACLSTNGSCSCPAVKALGGSTVHNAMIYLRGNPADYDHWAALGNEGWTWEEVMPFFLKGEDNGEIDRVGREYHATGGPLSVERFPYQPAFLNSIIAAGEEAGFGYSDDLNGNQRTGFSIVQTTSKNGVRHGSATSYLRPIRHRTNFHVSLNSTCTRVIIEDKKAVGVEFYKNGRFQTVRASREVVLSAGTIRSPHLLFLSGIGPKKHLESMGIQVVEDLPGVGENFHDHMALGIGFTVNQPDVYDNNWAAAAEYLSFQTGPLSCSGLNQMVARIKSEDTLLDSPDIVIIAGGYLADCAPGGINSLRGTGKRIVYLGTGIELPKSRGRISLASNDPFEYPVIWGNYLSEASDINSFLRGIDIVLKLANTEAMRVHNLTLSVTPLEACSNLTFLSKEYWICVIRQDAIVQYHMAGTCKMGPTSDPLAVVDPQLRVHGIKGLRVVDTSIMPQLISANSGGPTMMIGERAADFIKKDWYKLQNIVLPAEMAYNYSSPVTCNDAALGPSLAEMCGASAYYNFLSILNAFVTTKQKISGSCERVKSIETPDPEYDYIVVGGGGAGSVVAARLSENPDWKVLVIEAGPDESAGASIPGFLFAVADADDWGYRSRNESHGCRATNGSCHFQAAKVLGGSTVHNGLVYLRGNPTDYDNWAAMGNVGWSWKHVKPFFLKGENNGEIDRVGRFWHATGGPVSVERLPYQPPLTNSILTAAMETGIGISEDLNGNQLTGLSVVQTTSKDGVRRSSARAYLWPVRHRKNLQISLNSTCTRVIIENKIAVGVEYYQNGKFLKVRAAREVIVSAGTIASPQLLLLSGIGPKEHLDSVGVRVVQDLPGIGENFQDQIMYNLQYTLDEPDIYDNNWAAASEYLAFQTGPVSCNGLEQVVGAVASKATQATFPDIQIFASGYVAGCAPGELDVLKSTGKRTVTLWAAYHHTRSRGRISLASSNPFDKPVIWSNVLSEPADVAGLIEAINITLKLANTDALKAHNFTLSTTPMDVCSDHPFLSTEYWVCALRQSVVPRAHTGGTCKMGPSSDPMAVVDPQLRVYGIKGLRVADASIMPMVTSANTAGPTMMIGERAAGFIKKHSMQNFQRDYVQ